MSSIVAGRLDDLPSDIRDHLGAFRHRVFVQRLRWELPGVSADATSEWDEFDGGSTVHVIALSADEQVCGCARLMPTTGPYLLRDVFPELARQGQDGTPPSSPSIWEMSRFAGSELPADRTGSTSGMSLFPYAMALARSFGATDVIGVLTRSVARLYRRYGLDLHDIGVGRAPGCANIVACSIGLDLPTFDRLERDPVRLLNSITCFGHFKSPEHDSPGYSHPTAPGAPCGCTPDDIPVAVCADRTVHTQAPASETGTSSYA